MPLPNLPTYEVQEIESKANQLLIERFGDSVESPIDVDLLLESIPGVILDFARRLRDRYSVEGMVMRNIDTGEYLVEIDEDLADQQPTRYRMTVAE